MHLLPDDMAMLPPFVCTVCEKTPIRSGVPAADIQRVVDSLIDLEIDYAHHLEGRKYVCESCVREMAELLNLGDTSEVDDLRAANIALTAKNNDMTELLNAAQRIVTMAQIADAEQVEIADAEQAADS